MSERTVSVSLVAKVNGYIASMNQAQRATMTATQKLEAQKRAMGEVGRAAVAMGAVAAAGVAIAIKKFADFDAQMSLVKTLSHATADEMSGLRDAALHAGQGIGFSAVQVAEAETELVKAGISVKNIMGGSLVGALNLAAAGQIDVGQATEIAAEAMTQFKLKGKDVPHIADLLAAGADKALGGVDDLGTALESGGLVAAQFGLSIEGTVGTLAAFAQAGLLGERAGTGLRQMLLKLGNPSKEAADLMDKYNISLYDAQGNFVGMSNLAGQLRDKLGKLDNSTRNAALATIFGSRAIQGANVLYENGAKGIQEWIDKVNDSGFASEQARGKMDNLQGDLKKLGAAVDTALIETGSAANDVLRGLTQSVTGLAQWVGGLPKPFLAASLGLGGVTAAVLLFGGTALIAVPKIAALKLAVKELNLTGKGLARTLSKGGVLVAGLMLLAEGLAHAGDEAKLTEEQLARVDSAFQSGNIKQFGKDLSTASFAASDLKGSLDKATGTGFVGWATSMGHASANISNSMTFGLIPAIDDMANKLGGTAAQFKEWGLRLSDVATSDLPAAQTSFAKLADAMGGSDDVIKELLTAMPDYKAKLIELAGQQGITLSAQDLLNVAMGKGDLAARLATTSTAKNSEALADLSDKAEDADGSISDLADAIRDFGKGALDTRSATRDFEAAVDDATDSIKENGRSLDVNTDKGRANQAALDNIAKTALAVSSAIATQTGSAEKATEAMATGRAEFIKAAIAMGKTTDEANKLADQLGLVPSNVQVAVETTGIPQAEKAINGFITRQDGRRVRLYVDTYGGQAYHTQGTLINYKAAGGPVHGPGTSTSDSIPTMLSNGEYVANALAASKPTNRRALDFMNAGGTMPGLASGGPVKYVPATYSTSNTIHNVAQQGAQIRIDMPITAPPTMDPTVIGHVMANDMNALLRRLS